MIMAISSPTYARYLRPANISVTINSKVAGWWLAYHDCEHFVFITMNPFCKTSNIGALYGAYEHVRLIEF